MKEGIDYYILPGGLFVFTAAYLAARGYCCGNGCLHCPYDLKNVPEPKRTELKKKRDTDATGQKG